MLRPLRGSRAAMPAVVWTTFSQMSDTELQAIWMYLQSLPALPDNAYYFVGRFANRPYEGNAHDENSGNQPTDLASSGTG